MSTLQIILDTNVLYTGLKSKKGASYQLLSILNDHRFQLNLSTALVFEYEEILKRDSLELNLTLEEIDEIISTLCLIGNHHQIFYLWRPIAKDPDDDFLIDLAMESQADYIVSYNKQDLRPAESLGIQIVTPKRFLQLIGEIL